MLKSRWPLHTVLHLVKCKIDDAFPSQTFRKKTITRSAMDAPYTRMRWMPLTHESQCEIGDGFPLRIAHVRRDTHWYCDTQCYIFSKCKIDYGCPSHTFRKTSITKSAMDVPYTRIPMQNWRWITLTHRTREQEQKNVMFFKCTKQWVNMSKRHCRDGRGEAPFPFCRALRRLAMGRYRVRNAQNQKPDARQKPYAKRSTEA